VPWNCVTESRDERSDKADGDAIATRTGATAVKNTRQKSRTGIIFGSEDHQADLQTNGEPSHMSSPLELEFVLVSSDYSTMNAVSGGVKKHGGKFILVPNGEAARECLNRRKIDGVFVDLEVPGALGVIEGIRKGASNSKAVIFACVASAKEHTHALNAGANFLLRKPLQEDNIALHITIAKELMDRERRRYFRHALSIPVVLKDGSAEQNARMTNLSEGGIAVRTVKPLKYSAVIDFSFDLFVGATISGKGQVAWINSEGVAGIVLQIFHGKGKENLESWVSAQEQLGTKDSDTKASGDS